MASHPVVAKIQKSLVVWDRVSRAELARSVRILNDVAAGAESRGYVVRAFGEGIQIVVAQRAYSLTIREKKAERIDYSGILELSLYGPGFNVYGMKLRDSKRAALGARVGKLFEAIAAAHLVADAEDAARAEGARIRALERAARHERERAEHVHQQLRKVLRSHHDSWVYANQLRAYAGALEGAASEVEGIARADAEEWISWIRVEADNLDPLRFEIRVPKVEPLPDRKLT